MIGAISRTGNNSVENIKDPFSPQRKKGTMSVKNGMFKKRLVINDQSNLSMGGT